MQTTDTSNLFQSDAQQAKSAYRAAKAVLHEKTGDPIQLGSKPLRLVVSQRQHQAELGLGDNARRPEAAEGISEADAWVAESGFVIRRVGLNSGKTKQLFRGHTGPVTSLDFFSTKIQSTPQTPPREILVTGSWDKSIRVWDVQTKSPISTTIAHTDFVKSLIVIPSLDIVVSGSSDKDIRVWDLSHLSSTVDFSSLQLQPSTLVPADAAPETAPSGTGAAPPSAKAVNPLPFLLSLKGHTRPIERLAYYQVQIASDSTGKDDADGQSRLTNGHVVLLSVDSLGTLKTWELWREGNEVKGGLRTESRPHEIGIYDIVVGEGEIWTASADNSILLSTYDATNPLAPPIPTTRIPHPSGVRSLLPLPLALPSLNAPYLLTGSSDEVIRIINISDVDSSVDTEAKPYPWTGIPLAAGSPVVGLAREVDGHSHDIVDFGVYLKEEVDESGKMKKEAWVVSASLDGTLRRWKWPNVLLEKVEKVVLVPVEEEPKKKESLLTEEEERELAELMGDDE
ncbi:WD40 repeat-like protein [Meredithblackwellia eburnea MCA 4105]